MAPKPDSAALREAAAQDRAAVDGQVLKDAYALRGASGLTKKLEEMGRERAARAAKTIGYDHD